MSRMGNSFYRLACGLPLLAVFSFAQGNMLRPGMQVMRPVTRRGAAPVPPPAAPMAAVAPAAPLTMNQQPAVPPQVTYQAGMLTIVAQNSVLGDILREVHRLTGAAIDVPPNATERVVTKLGPGAARDVLADLLNGSSFNYVMLGSVSDPATVATVMLTTKSAAPAGGGGNDGNVYQPSPQPYAQAPSLPIGSGPGGPVVQPSADDEEADAEDQKDEEDPAEAQAGDQAQNGQAAPPSDGSAPNSGPKTPEQILEMLRQRQSQIVPGQVMRPPNPQPQQQQPPDDNN
jgi:hypothetical protein